VRYFLNSRSNASRASLALRGGGVLMFVTGRGPCEKLASRATVTRGENNEHSLAWSFTAMRAGTGLLH
jgi:hypothetical protein